MRLILAPGAGAVAVAAIVGLAGCGGSASGAAVRSAPTTQASASPTPNIQQIANELLAAENKMITADNSHLAEFNSSNPPTATAGINATIADHQTFDSALQGIAFPPAVTSDVAGVLTADVAYENALATLAVNTDNAINYNSVFATTVPLESQFEAALSTLNGDFGIT